MAGVKRFSKKNLIFRPVGSVFNNSATGDSILRHICGTMAWMKGDMPVTLTASHLLLNWYDEVKRDLPWRQTKDPYRIWLSEIMLQQTRVETVKGYYARFLEWFPTVDALACAAQERVLKAWEGLGYYSRARNLQKAAQVIVNEFGGVFPASYEDILSLPGIGLYTAGAVGSIAFDLPVPAVDGNVYRVASRFFGIREDVGIPRVQKLIWQQVKDSIPADRPGDYNQALMELGATHCCPGTPRCDLCPWNELCDACLEGDADVLPVHEKKKPPKQIDMAVCLLTDGQRIFTMPRTERMLSGLSVFWLIEEETRPEQVRELLSESGFHVRFVQEMGEAKHVFTHRVWNMRLMQFELMQSVDAALLEKYQARMVTRDEMLALPFPSAMGAAVEAAKKLI